MTLATADKTGVPNVAPVLFTVDNDFNFYFVTRAGTRKHKNILVNKRVSMSIWHHNSLALQVDGLASQLIDKKGLESVVEELANKAVAEDKNFWPPVLRFCHSQYVVLKIKPTRLRLIDLSQPNIVDQDSPITEIKF